MGYFEFARPTYLENWPTALLRHSIATGLLALESDEQEALIDGNINGVPALRLAQRIDDLIGQLPDGAFIRLGSRSPKDAWLADEQGLKVTSGAQAVALLADSQRVRQDLMLAQKHAYRPFVAVREWLEIESYQEHRVFILNRRFVGACQHHHFDAIPELSRFASSIAWAIERKMPQIIRDLHVDSAVLDVVVTLEQRGNRVRSSVRLLDLNPAGIWTDPCLFSWHELLSGDIQGEYRWLGSDGRIRSITA